MQKKNVARALGIALLVGAAWLASAQSAPPASSCADYLAAAQWDAAVSFNYAHVAQDSTGKVDLSADANGRATLPRVPDPFPGISIPEWTGLAQGSGFVHDIIVGFQPQPPDDVIQADGAGGLQGVATSNASIIFLNLDSSACTYTFTWTPAVDVTITTNNGSSTGVDAIGSVQSVPRPLPAVTPGQPLPPLTGNAAFAADFGFGPPGDHYVPERMLQSLFLPGQLLAQNPSSAAVQWIFNPNVEAIELVVALKRGSVPYEDWLPEGEGGPVDDSYAPQPGEELENTEGNTLEIEATVRRVADGLPPQTRNIQKIEFEMTQRSSEPGIALNVPPAGLLASPQPADLKFDGARNLAQNPVVVVDLNDSSRAEAPLLAGGNTATAILSSYDWGSFGTLEVHATLDVGNVLVGHLITDPSIQQIPIPKRTAPSNVADKWKIDQQVVGKADLDDDEDNPGGTGDDLGDGISMYEEYRGFFVGGFHPRSLTDGKRMDPRKKDLFVKNEYGPVLIPGFKMLADEGRLNVHYALLDGEIDAGSVVNFNHGHANVVDQHGVRVIRGKADRNLAGKAVRASPGRNLLLPRSTVHVFIVPERFGRAATADELARTTAHEVAHAISVPHHGETDSGLVTWIRDPTGDVAEDDGGPTYPIELRREAGCGGAGCPMTPAEIAALFNNKVFKSVYVGGHRGEHSGHADCFMRYDAAAAYTREPTQVASPRVRWWVGDEDDGPRMDDAATGTGVNSVFRGAGLQSRYGDACSALDRGDCRHRIRVSDALPDEPVLTNNGAACP